MQDETLVLNMFQQSHEAIIALDFSGQVLFWNTAAEQLFGLKKEEVVGKFFPLVQDRHSFELATIITKAREGTSMTFRTQKQHTSGEKLDLIFHTSPFYQDDQVMGISLLIQQSALIKNAGYLQIDIDSKNKESKRTFKIIRELILLTLDQNKKTINQIANNSGINWRTVEKHLTFLIGKKLVSEIFSSEYVRIFELTEFGKKDLQEKRVIAEEF